MALADPKKYAQTKAVESDDDDQTMAEKLEALQEQVAALLAAKSAPATSDDDRLEKILLRVAQMSADAHERAANPSNKTHPGISVFSRPMGERADPRDALKCEMFWVGYPIDLDTTTDAEINLLNLAEPGSYHFKRTDSTLDTLTVSGDRTPDGRVHRLMFEFPITERRETLPSMENMLRTSFGVKTPEQIELDALRAEVARLKVSDAVSA
jgi:hypothetical protein